VPDARGGDPLAGLHHTLLKAGIERMFLQSLKLPGAGDHPPALRDCSDGYAYTLSEIGKIFSVTRERIRQIENSGHAQAERADLRKATGGFSGISRAC